MNDLYSIEEGPASSSIQLAPGEPCLAPLIQIATAYMNDQPPYTPYRNGSTSLFRDSKPIDTLSNRVYEVNSRKAPDPFIG